MNKQAGCTVSATMTPAKVFLSENFIQIDAGDPHCRLGRRWPDLLLGQK